MLFLPGQHLAKAWDISKNIVLSEIKEHWIEKHFQIFYTLTFIVIRPCHACSSVDILQFVQYYSVHSAYLKWINFSANFCVNHLSASLNLWSIFMHYLHCINKMNVR
jgi:hypothetical protein